MELWTLPNGMQVVSEQFPHIRTVSVGVFVHVGSQLELPEENGLSHFIEHMVFKGTEHRTLRQIAEETDAQGGYLNAYTGRDHTCFYTRVIDEDLPQALSLLSDLALHATFPEDELDRERGVVLEEIAMSEDDPNDVLADLVNVAMYGGHPSGQTVLGPADRVAAYTRDDLMNFRNRHYTPDRTVLAVCGSFDPAVLREEVLKYFGDWAAAGTPAAFEPPVFREGVRMARDKEIEQLHLCLGFPAPVFGDPKMVPLQIMSSVLGGAMSSRLFQRIREELGMAYSVSSFASGMEGAGSFHIYAGVSPKNGARVLEEIMREYRKILDEGITEKEFEETRKQRRISLMMGMESASAWMSAMGTSQLILGRVRTAEDRLKALEKVTMADVAAVTRECLSAAPCLCAVGAEASRFLEGLG
jgi:predicted Zn-dependent peptidase